MERRNTSPGSRATALHRLGSLEDAPVDSVRLVVLGSQAPVTYVLPAEGSFLVGRTETADVRIDEESISRKHAILHIDEKIALEDLGSLNGTRVGEQRLQKGEIADIFPGEAFELGKVMCIVQRKSTTSRKRLRLRSHGYLEERLDEQIDRLHDTGGRLCVARIHGADVKDADEWDAHLAGVMGAMDLAAEYAPGELEILFFDLSRAEVEKRCEKAAHSLRAAGKAPRFAVAEFPVDGRTPAALLGVVHARVSSLGVHEDSMSAGAGVGFVGGGAMDKLRRLVERVAKSELSIVLHGETGVGKEVLAREIHKASERADKPFVGLNCAALTESLLESELFGHERGAFSGAVATKPGLFEVAEGGTVFLDEVAEMSPSIQVKLLRVLEERKVLRVGGLQPRPIDVRFLSASHRDLEEDVVAGRFRQDLFFRLNGITLEIPPLRERVDEVDALVALFLREATKKSRRTSVPRMAPEAMQLLREYSWPGNVRELKNVVERAVVLCADDVITLEHLPVEKMRAARRTPRADVHVTSHIMSRSASAPALRELAGGRTFPDVPTTHPTGFSGSGAPADAPLKDAMDELERSRIMDALNSCAGNQTRAAKMLGISRRTLLNRLDDYGVPRPKKR